MNAIKGLLGIPIEVVTVSPATEKKAASKAEQQPSSEVPTAKTSDT